MSTENNNMTDVIPNNITSISNQTSLEKDYSANTARFDSKGKYQMITQLEMD